jgi:aquaporin Z
MEAAGLGLFMVSAGLFGTLLEYPNSPLHLAMPSPLVRRILMGLAMGLTAIGLIYYPWGQQSGAHYNPAVTLTFLRLGKVGPWDAAFYVLAQFVGGVVGVLLVAGLLRASFARPPVQYVATLPGPSGVAIAFIAEAVISGLLMATVLVSSNSARLMPFTGAFAGVLLFLYITFEAPLSGMSINPARTVASAVPARLWTSLWVYFLAPPLGMLMAAEAYLAVGGHAAVHCAKLNHMTARRCIFCGSGTQQRSPSSLEQPDAPPGIQEGA